MKLDDGVIELIAIGASITANCQPCLQYHVGRALETGADEEETREAIEVGKMVRRGAASKMDKFASSVNAALPSPAGVSTEGCGCG
jgi:AhpD family alkylhydroperoxidase